MRLDRVNGTNVNTNFNALKKIRCKNDPRTFWEGRIIDELKKVSLKHDFFKKNNVNAFVSVERYFGAQVILKYKPIGENFIDKVKNFFKPYKEYVMRDSHSCPDDSSYFIAKNLRDKKKSKDFLEN